ncbi:hypothetical protein Y032_0028g1789 [Ancylostoma ceylanicum]|nr:hypothetical protein Y032_0028g1789 [Ancylostoma ceylanicum]
MDHFLGGVIGVTQRFMKALPNVKRNCWLYMCTHRWRKWEEAGWRTILGTVDGTHLAVMYNLHIRLNISNFALMST